MKKMTGLVLGLAVATALGTMAGCEGDPSAPTRPRTQLGPLAPDEKAKENADKRETEEPKREFPTSGKEFPGQSKAAEAGGGATVVTADTIDHLDDPWLRNYPGIAKTSNARYWPHRPASSLDIPADGSNSWPFPENNYHADYYPGPLPHLPENPGTTPMAGFTQVPGTEWVIDHSWGQVMELTDYPHRDWPATQATYAAGVFKHNPVYFANLQDRLPVKQPTGSYASGWMSNLYEVPWFYAQTLALPVMVCLECPLSQVTTQRLGSDPNYFSHLPTTGPVVPAPTEGVIRWEYPFLLTTGQDVTTMPASVPIAPTPGMVAVPEAGAPGPVVPIEPPSSTPGLK